MGIGLGFFGLAHGMANTARALFGLGRYSVKQRATLAWLSGKVGGTARHDCVGHAWVGTARIGPTGSKQARHAAGHGRTWQGVVQQ